jgi:hypothetical protein
LLDIALVNAYIYWRKAPISGNDKLPHQQFRLDLAAQIKTQYCKDLGAIFIWTSRELNREELPINPQVQVGGISVMFWGYIHSNGLGPLVAIDGSMNAKKYIAVLTENLLDELDVLEEAHGAPMTFMQDNAPCHKAKLVMYFLAEKALLR